VAVLTNKIKVFQTKVVSDDETREKRKITLHKTEKNIPKETNKDSISESLNIKESE